MGILGPIDNEGRLIAYKIGDILYRPEDVTVIWAGGTNPETCRHNILTAGVNKNNESFVFCVSCGVETTEELWKSRPYEYDIDANVWVNTPRKNKE